MRSDFPARNRVSLNPRAGRLGQTEPGHEAFMFTALSTTLQVAAAIHHAEYPASKADLLNAARRQCAPREIVSVIERLPKGPFDSFTDVLDVVSDVL